MALNLDELAALSEVPSVATACGPVGSVLRGLLPGHEFIEVQDGGLAALPRGTAPEAVRFLFVTHVDEIGGFVMFPVEGGYEARLIGNQAAAFAETPLQAFRYDATDASVAIPCRGFVSEDGRLILQGDGLEPLTMLWTFRESFRVEGDIISGKALDPRVTVYCAVVAARRLRRSDAALLFCFAEECSRTPMSKLVEYVRREMPAVQTLVNADVPGLNNIAGIGLEDAAIRPFEGSDLIDPCFSLSLYERLRERSVEVKLAVAASRSQTGMFAPLAQAVSIALPSRGVHQARVEMSLAGVERCTRLLQAIGELA